MTALRDILLANNQRIILTWLLNNIVTGFLFPSFARRQWKCALLSVRSELVQFLGCVDAKRLTPNDRQYTRLTNQTGSSRTHGHEEHTLAYRLLSLSAFTATDDRSRCKYVSTPCITSMTVGNRVCFSLFFFFHVYIFVSWKRGNFAIASVHLGQWCYWDDFNA